MGNITEFTNPNLVMKQLNNCEFFSGMEESSIYKKRNMKSPTMKGLSKNVIEDMESPAAATESTEAFEDLDSVTPLFKVNKVDQEQPQEKQAEVDQEQLHILLDKMLVL